MASEPDRARPGALPGVRAVSERGVILARWVVPEPRFARRAPAGRRSSDTPGSAPGGQPNPACSGEPAQLSADGAVLASSRYEPACQPRWARCPVQGEVHLLAPVAVDVALSAGQAHALCGRSIAAAGLTLRAPGVVCVYCLAVGSSPGGDRGW